MEQTVNVRIPRELWERIRHAAEADRRSASAELALAIEEWLGSRKEAVK